MKLSCIALLLLIAIGFNYINEADAHRWGGWGHGGWGGWGWNRPWIGGWGWNRPWFGGWGRPWFGGWGRPWIGGWGNRWFKRSAEAISEPTVNCKYIQSSKLLSCEGLSKKVECESTFLFDKETSQSFTLSRIPSQPIDASKTRPEEIKYSLYPQKLDKSAWLDTKVMDPVLQKSFTYSLYHLPIYTESGLRVDKPICWRTLVDLLRDASTRVDTIPVLKEDGQIEDVKVIGQITVV